MALAGRKKGRELRNCLRAAVGVTATTLPANIERDFITPHGTKKAINKRNGGLLIGVSEDFLEILRHKEEEISMGKALLTK